MANKRRQPACIESRDRLRGRARVGWQSPGASGTNDREITDIGSILILANEPLNTEKQISLSTAQIQEMVSGAFTNNGFIIIADTELNDRFNYKSSDASAATKRPKLVIEYTTSSATSTPTNTPTPGPSPTPTNTSTPTVAPTATATNPPAAPFNNAIFVYDGDGRRVKSVFNGTTTTYFVGAHYEVSGSTITKYYYAGSQRIAMRTNGTLNYLLGDHLGSTSLTADASGQVVSELRYKAWGETRYASGSTSPKYQYTSQFSYVNEFGLMFYNARWLDVSLGRFAQADTIIPGNIQGLDRYAYVYNNPLAYIDPSGHCGVKQGKFDGRYDCTVDDINSASIKNRLTWFLSFLDSTGREEWFANIVGILEAFIDEGLGEPGSWISWTDSGILVSIQNGFALFDSNRSNNSDADMAWKDFFSAETDVDRKVKWGTAENLGTQYGLFLAEEHGAVANEREQQFLHSGNRLYRDLLQNGEIEEFYGQLAADVMSQYCDPSYRSFCSGWVDGWQSVGTSFGEWFGDPRSTDPIFGKAPVYYIARLILDK